MNFRNEVKFEISSFDMITLRSQLSAVMQHDKYAVNGSYEISSLYFDNLYDTALKEKINGISVREKFRIRIYNNDQDFIKLERKYKNNSLGNKTSVILSRKQAEDIISGNISFLAESNDEVFNSFYVSLRQNMLIPKVIVSYSREPFVFKPGNVRVTLDYNLRTSNEVTRFFDSSRIDIPAKYSPNIMEVKWDNYLPDVIKDIIRLEYGYSNAFSKYASSRMYD